MNTNAKYRPVLSAKQIEHILQLAKKDIANRPEAYEAVLNASIISTLAPFMAKIENNGISPAYTSTPKESLEYSLGIESKASSEFPKELLWKKAYEKYSTFPNLCSPKEVAQAREWMYLNDLFTPEERQEFEATAPASSQLI